MKRDYMTGFYFSFAAFFLPLRTPICCSFCSAHWPSATPQCCLSFLFFLASIARWMRKNDCDISHRFHINASGSDAGQAHWFLFWMSQENTKNWGPHKFEKWNSLPLNWLTCFSGLCFPGEGCVCVGGVILHMHRERIMSQLYAHL